MSNIQSDEIRLSGIIQESIVDGPGLRYVIFTQGCHKRCIGCHNPSTHDLLGGEIYKINDVIKQFKQNPLLRGITISGGEPFIQADKCVLLTKAAKEVGLDVLVYSGYYYEELKKSKNPHIIELLNLADYLIDGPFEYKLKNLNLLFRGSSNQRIIDLKQTIKTCKIALYDETLV